MSRVKVQGVRLMPIGRFAEVSRLSLKALRIYERLGLLRPSHVDGESGYRYYSEDQLRPARLIALLRRLQMPLATIQRVLAAQDEEARQILDAYWGEVEARTVAGRRIVAYLHQEMGGGRAVAYEVRVREVPAAQAVSVLREVYVKDLPAFINDSFHQLFRHIAAHGGKGAGHGMVIYHGEVNDDSNGPVEVCVSVERSTVPPEGTIRLIDLPAGPEAYATITMAQCRFPEILGAYDAVHTYLKENSLQMAASPREIYFADDDKVGPDDPYCDVAWPFQR